MELVGKFESFGVILSSFNLQCSSIRIGALETRKYLTDISQVASMTTLQRQYLIFLKG